MQQNKALCGSWAPHSAGRTEYGVTNDDVENVEQRSKHVLVLKLVFQIFAHRGLCQACRECIATVQACPGFKTFIPHFRPRLR